MASSAGIHLYFPRRGLLFSAPQARGCPLTSSGARSKHTQRHTGPPPGKGVRNLDARGGHFKHKNGPVRPQPILHRGLTESLPEALSDIGYKRLQAHWPTDKIAAHSRAQADTSLEAAPRGAAVSLRAVQCSLNVVSTYALHVDSKEGRWESERRFGAHLG